MNPLRPGDFSTLARAYVNRPSYSVRLVEALAAQAGLSFADIGAGTGKLTQMLCRDGRVGVAIEPSDAMRAEGLALNLPAVRWSKGTAEATGLPDACVDWVTMASAFHWTDAPKALAEFYRILSPGGMLTLMWNPRDLVRDRLQARIEARITEIAPHIVRRSSGAAVYTASLEETLRASGLFGEPLFMEAPHVETMSVERHLNIWRSVNDIQAQAGEKWPLIMTAIEAELAGMEEIEVCYRTRAWTVWKASAQ